MAPGVFRYQNIVMQPWLLNYKRIPFRQHFWHLMDIDEQAAEGRARVTGWRSFVLLHDRKAAALLDAALRGAAIALLLLIALRIRRDSARSRLPRPPPHARAQRRETADAVHAGALRPDRQLHAVV